MWAGGVAGAGSPLSAPTHAHTCTHTNTHTRVRTNTHTRARIQIRIHVRAPTRTHVHIQTRIHVRARARLHTHTHTTSNCFSPFPGPQGVDFLNPQGASPGLQIRPFSLVLRSCEKGRQGPRRTHREGGRELAFVERLLGARH